MYIHLHNGVPSVRPVEINFFAYMSFCHQETSWAHSSLCVMVTWAPCIRRIWTSTWNLVEGSIPAEHAVFQCLIGHCAYMHEEQTVLLRKILNFINFVRFILLLAINCTVFWGTASAQEMWHFITPKMYPHTPGYARNVTPKMYPKFPGVQHLRMTFHYAQNYHYILDVISVC